MPRYERVMNILKGDIFYIMKPQQYQRTGSEQGAGRPGIIVSNDIGNEHSDCVEVVFLTTKDKNPLPTHVEVLCHVPSTALCEQIFTVSKERIGNYIRTCTDEEMAEIDNALMISLGIEPQSNVIMENALKLTCENLKKEKDEMQVYIDQLKNEGIALKEELDALKKSDKVVILPDNTEDTMRLGVERDFYKSQYEALLERMIGKAVQV